MYRCCMRANRSRAQPLIDFLGPSPRTWNKLTVSIASRFTGTLDKVRVDRVGRTISSEEGRQGPRRNSEAERDQREQSRAHHRSVVAALGRIRLCLPVRLTCTLRARISDGYEHPGLMRMMLD